MASNVRQLYHKDCEEALNEQIALELEAMYTYLSLASHFCRHDTALPGLAQYFNKAMREELGHVQLLSEYQNKRGGKVCYRDIKKPEKDEWGTGMYVSCRQREGLVDQQLFYGFNISLAWGKLSIQ